jgi:hypothetical protein
MALVEPLAPWLRGLGGIAQQGAASHGPRSARIRCTSGQQAASRRFSNADWTMR